jgi:DNA-binding Lrp family transcriptional regulator
MYSTSGCYDIMLTVRARDRRELERIVEQIEDVAPNINIQTYIVFETVKRYSNLNPFEIHPKARTTQRIDTKESVIGTPCSNSTKLSEKDLKILALLRKDAKMRIKKIAKFVESHPSTVLYRISRMERLGIILKQYPVMRFAKIGYKYTAITLIKVAKGAKKRVLKKLRREANISAVYSIAGGFDIMSIIRTRTLDELKSFITWTNREAGVIGTFSNLVIDTFKIHSDYNPLEHLIR